MNLLARFKPPQTPDYPCPDLAAMAERELSAFFNAITQMFGAEQAKLSAEGLDSARNSSEPCALIHRTTNCLGD